MSPGQDHGTTPHTVPARIRNAWLEHGCHGVCPGLKSMEGPVGNGLQKQLRGLPTGPSWVRVGGGSISPSR